MKIERSVSASSVFQQCEKEIRARFPTLLPDVYPAFSSPETWCLTAERHQLPQAGGYLAVGSLLDECSALIARCIELKDSKLDLEARAIEFWLEAEQLDKRDEIKRKQINAGDLTLAGNIAEIELEMEQKASAAYRRCLDDRREADSARTPGSSIYESRVKIGSDVASLSAYSNFDLIKKKAAELSENQMLYEKAASSAELNSSLATAAIHEKLGEIAKLKFDNEDKIAPLRLEAFEADVSARLTRERIAAEPGVGLNYRERFKQINEFFIVEYQCLLERLPLLEAGIRERYGFKQALPDLTTSLVSDFAVWVRLAVEHYWRLHQRETSFILSISVRTSAGEAAWGALLTSGSCFFEVADPSVQILQCLRILSVRGFVESNARGRWTISMKPPEIAFWRLPDQSEVKVTQNSAGYLVLGGIGSKHVGQPNAGCAGRSMEGFSPVGDWHIKVQLASDCGEALTVVDDIVIEFEVTGILGS